MLKSWEVSVPPEQPIRFHASLPQASTTTNLHIFPLVCFTIFGFFFRGGGGNEHGRFTESLFFRVFPLKKQFFLLQLLWKTKVNHRNHGETCSQSRNLLFLGIRQALDWMAILQKGWSLCAKRGVGFMRWYFFKKETDSWKHTQPIVNWWFA